jgi:hypothetical protein
MSRENAGSRIGDLPVYPLAKPRPQVLPARSVRLVIEPPGCYFSRVFSRAGRAILGRSLAVGWLLGVAGCGGQTISLGDRRGLDAGGVGGSPSIEPTLDATPDAPLAEASPADAPTVDATDGGWPPGFTQPTRIAALLSTAQTDNPTLTEDGRLIVFSSLRGDGSTNSDIYCASRELVTQDFGPPQRIPTLAPPDAGIDAIEGSPAISRDGKRLWLSIKSSETGAFSDIYQSLREVRDDANCSAGWPEATPVAELNSSADDIPRPLGNGHLTMPLGSRRDGTLTGNHFVTYLATRTSESTPFSDIRWAKELDATGFNTADAFLTQDGLTIYFTRAANPVIDIYVAHRTTTDAPFDPPVPLPGFSDADYKEQDPFVATDGTLYFTANYDGPLNIYQASPSR